MWKTSAATLLVWMLSFTLRRRSAAVRHVLWISALAAFLIVPSLLPIARHTPAVRLPASLPDAVPSAFASPPPVVGTPVQRAQRAPVPWTKIAIALWFAGFFVIAIRRYQSAMTLRKIVDRATSIPDWESGVLLSDEVETPLTCGILRPMIVLPKRALNWSPECLSSALLHEREHLRRNDCLWHWVAEGICAIWWFHPFAWLARNRAAHERECACDDAVLREGIRPSDYASALLHLASGRTQPGEPAMALSALSNFERRIRSLLLPNLDRRPAGRRVALAISLAATAIILPLAVLHAQDAGTGDLSGTVIDMSGARVPGAQIIASGSSGNREVTRTDAAGEWSLSGIPAGKYTIETLSRGFVKGITPANLEAGQHATAEIRLSVGSVQETIEVVAQGQPRRAAVQPSASPERIRVGGNVQATRLLKQVKPRYPDSAKAQGIEGSVLMNAIIGKEGNLLSLTVVNKLADPDLAAAALDAVKHWLYQPTLLNGQPVEVVTTITVNFRLEN
jgi:TonB family protein